MALRATPCQSKFFPSPLPSKGFALLLFFFLSLFISSATAQLSNEQQIKVDLTLEKDPIKRVDLLLKLVDEYRYDQPERALSLALQAEELSDSITYQKGLMVSNRKLAGLYWALSDYSSAMECANITLAIAQKLEDHHERAGIIRTMGIILKPLGENKKAVEYFFESLQLYEELKDSMGLAQVYNSIGTIFSEQNEWDSAIEYFEKALIIFRQTHNLMGIAGALNNIAIVLPKDSSNLENKKSLLFEAVRINQQIGQKYWEAINYENLGSIYLESQMLDSAYYYLAKSKEILVALKSMPHLADNLILLSHYYILLENYDKALEYGQQALEIGLSHGLPNNIMNSLNQLAKIYLLRADTVKAYKHSIRYQQIKDSLDEQNSYTRITHLEKLYEMDKLEQERKYLYHKQIFRYALTLIGVIALAIGIVTTLVVRHRFKLKNGLPTVAVLGHGLDQIYPSVHTGTAKEIIGTGALVSDFPSGTAIDGRNFVKRNRIIAGLSDATLVIESANQGGSLITADLAMSYNREVFAIPGCIGSKYSEGCNLLIKTNKAAMIESVEDIEYQLGWDMGEGKDTGRQLEMFKELSDEEQTVFNVIQDRGQEVIDVICFKTGLPVAKVSAILLNLEFAGLIKSRPGKVFALSRKL